MSKLAFFKTLLVSIIIINIVNYFFMVTSINGVNVTEGATLFDASFFAYKPLDNALGYETGSGGGNNCIIFFICFLIDIVLMYIAFIKINKYGIRKYIIPIYILSSIEIILHCFSFMICIPSEINGQTYLLMLGKGMICNLLYIISYIAIIEISHYIVSKGELNLNEEIVKITFCDLLIVIILLELLLSFFYVSVVDKYYILKNTPEGIKKIVYNRFYFSPFVMCNKHTNVYGFEGKTESYPYMWIMLGLLIIQIALVLIKKKYFKYIIIGISIVNIILLLLGIIDIMDSFYAHYITSRSINFFNIAGVGFYFIVILNLIIIFLSLNNSDKVIIALDSEYSTEKDDSNSNQMNEDNILIINEKID